MILLTPCSVDALQIAEDLKRLPKSVNRQVYVRRIMDIMHNLEKQKIDIKKVCSDFCDILIGLCYKSKASSIRRREHYVGCV